MKILSLGAGVQSSTLALMSESGDLPKFNACIFADTQDEPPSVYKWLAWLESQLSIPVVRVSKGKLSVVAIKVRTSKKTGETYTKPQIPAYALYPDKTKGRLFRHCSADFKLDLIRREAKKLSHGNPIEMLIGISMDEVHRMKPSDDPKITNFFPLIEKRMTRTDCLSWMQSHGYPKPPRSACVMCPFHSDREWLRLKKEEPESFQFAVEWEKKYQYAISQVNRMDSVPYLHNSRVPLDSIEFDANKNQPELFGNECLGVCGV